MFRRIKFNVSPVDVPILSIISIISFFIALTVDASDSEAPAAVLSTSSSVGHLL